MRVPSQAGKGRQGSPPRQAGRQAGSGPEPPAQRPVAERRTASPGCAGPGGRPPEPPRGDGPRPGLPLAAAAAAGRRQPGEGGEHRLQPGSSPASRRGRRRCFPAPRGTSGRRGQPAPGTATAPACSAALASPGPPAPAARFREGGLPTAAAAPLRPAPAGAPPLVPRHRGPAGPRSPQPPDSRVSPAPLLTSRRRPATGSAGGSRPRPGRAEARGGAAALCPPLRSARLGSAGLGPPLPSPRSRLPPGARRLRHAPASPLRSRPSLGRRARVAPHGRPSDAILLPRGGPGRAGPRGAGRRCCAARGLPRGRGELPGAARLTPCGPRPRRAQREEPATASGTPRGRRARVGSRGAPGARAPPLTDRA